MIVAGYEVGSAMRPADGFSDGGDCAIIREYGGVLLLGIVDAVGHGPQAYAVAKTVEELLDRTEAIEVRGLLGMLGEELARTVGAAVGLATLEPGTGQGRFAGIGNIAVRLVGRSGRSIVSADGVVGGGGGARGRREPVITEFRLNKGEVLLMHSDGISSRIGPDEHPRLMFDDAPTAARDLVRKFGRAHDDACCIVARLAG